MEKIVVIIVAAFIVFMAFNGYRRGGISILISMLSLILTILIAAYFTPAVTRLIKEKTPLYNTIYEQMEKFVDNKLDSDETDQNTALGKLPLPKSLTKVLEDNNNDSYYNAMGVNSFSAYTAQSLTYILLNAISFIAIFIIVNIIFRIVIVLGDIISKMPIISGINRLIGTVLGIIQAVLILWVLCIALTAISGTSIGQIAIDVIDGSKFLTFIFDNNLLFQIITSIVKVI
jgi:uncharacterized membrane protein required for colicin V production